LPPTDNNVHHNAKENHVEKRPAEAAQRAVDIYQSPPPPYTEEDKTQQHLKQTETGLGDHLLGFFIEFPTPHLLWEANTKYGGLQYPLPHSADGNIRPYPASTAKTEVFNAKKYESVDKFAIEVKVWFV
jgi:hypothetical protein